MAKETASSGDVVEVCSIFPTYNGEKYQVSSKCMLVFVQCMFFFCFICNFFMLNHSYSFIDNYYITEFASMIYRKR